MILLQFDYKRRLLFIEHTEKIKYTLTNKYNAHQIVNKQILIFEFPLKQSIKMLFN